MAPSKVAPVTDEEIVAVFTGERAQPLSANEVATAVWVTRGQSTPEVASRHTKPVLDRMVTDGTLRRAEGRSSANLLGRWATARENVVYYHLATAADAILREIERVRNERARAQLLAGRYVERHPDWFTAVYAVGTELRLNIPLPQAEKLLELLKPQSGAEPAQSTE